MNCWPAKGLNLASHKRHPRTILSAGEANSLMDESLCGSSSGSMNVGRPFVVVNALFVSIKFLPWRHDHRTLPLTFCEQFRLFIDWTERDRSVIFSVICSWSYLLLGFVLVLQCQKVNSRMRRSVYWTEIISGRFMRDAFAIEIFPISRLVVPSILEHWPVACVDSKVYRMSN